MSLVFDKNIEVTEFLLNILLERDDMKVIEVIGQREYKNPVFGGHDIRIDIYAKDFMGKVYAIEVQRSDEGADAHRARFNSSMVDARMLKEGQKYKELHDSYVIFITENDVLGSGLPLYHIDRTVRETDALFGDGSHIIYVNGSYKNIGNPIGKLMHDFGCRESADMFYPLLAEQVKYFKETEGGRGVMCKIVEEYAEKYAEKKVKESARESAEKSRLETLFQDICNLMETMKLSVEQAMEALRVSDADRAILLKRF